MMKRILILVALLTLSVTATKAQSVVVTAQTGTIKNGVQFAPSAAITTATTVQMFAAPPVAAGLIRNYLTGLEYINTGTTASEVQVLDGTTVVFRCMAPASMTAPACLVFQTPIVGTANTAMSFKVVTASTNTYANAQGFTAK